MKRILAVGLALVVALPALADPLRNVSRFGVDMRAGPGLAFPLIHVLDPGETADRGRCDLDGKWCLLRAGGKIGWVDTTGLVPPRVAVVPPDPVRPLSMPTVEQSVLGGTSRPLPDAITEAVRGAGRVELQPLPPGAGVPMIFATDAPFRNVTLGQVNLRAGPGTDAAIVGTLDPGRGGRIDVCDAAQRWCRIGLDDGRVGWVKMTLMGTRRIAVAPLAPDDVAAR